MSTSDQSSYFVRFRGRVNGPFTLERLRSMAYAGQISPIHEVSEDRASWISASEVPGLMPEQPEAIPVKFQPSAQVLFHDDVPRDDTFHLPPDSLIIRPGVGYGVTAMVLGIVSLVSGCAGFIPFPFPYAFIMFLGPQLVLGILAICFGAAGRRTEGRGMAMAGFVTGIISVSLLLLLAIFIAAMLVFVGRVFLNS